MKKLPLLAILLFSTVFVFGSTCLIGSDSNKSTETMTLAVDGMACEEACATKIETALNSQKGIKNADVCFERSLIPVFLKRKLCAFKSTVELSIE